MFTPTLDTGMANKLQLSQMYGYITGILHYRVAVCTYVHKEYIYHRGTTSQGGCMYMGTYMRGISQGYYITGVLHHRVAHKVLTFLSPSLASLHQSQLS